LVPGDGRETLSQARRASGECGQRPGKPRALVHKSRWNPQDAYHQGVGRSSSLLARLIGCGCAGELACHVILCKSGKSPIGAEMGPGEEEESLEAITTRIRCLPFLTCDSAR
jgi:hypothetical protein